MILSYAFSLRSIDYMMTMNLLGLHNKRALSVLFCLCLSVLCLGAEAQSGGRESADGIAPAALLFLLYMVGSAIRGYYRKKTTDTRPPQDINEQVFIEFLKERFMLMQRLRNNDDWDQVALYVDSATLSLLKKQRQDPKALKAPITEPDKLSVKIIAYETRKRNQTIVTVDFIGIDRHVFISEQWQLKRVGGAEAAWKLIKLTL